MKIALAHKQLDLKGGTERDLYRTAEGLRDLGHEVHLFARSTESKLRRGHFPIAFPCCHWAARLDCGVWPHGDPKLSVDIGATLSSASVAW